MATSRSLTVADDASFQRRTIAAPVVRDRRPELAFLDRQRVHHGVELRLPVGGAARDVLERRLRVAQLRAQGALTGRDALHPPAHRLEVGDDALAVGSVVTARVILAELLDVLPVLLELLVEILDDLARFAGLALGLGRKRFPSLVARRFLPVRLAFLGPRGAREEEENRNPSHVEPRVSDRGVGVVIRGVRGSR